MKTIIIIIITCYIFIILLCNIILHEKRIEINMNLLLESPRARCPIPGSSQTRRETRQRCGLSTYGSTGWAWPIGTQWALATAAPPVPRGNRVWPAGRPIRPPPKSVPRISDNGRLKAETVILQKLEPGFERPGDKTRCLTTGRGI